MSATDPITPDPRRFSTRLPRPLWIGMATVGLVFVHVGLRIGVPIYRQHVAIREIQRLGGQVSTREVRPHWARRWLPDSRIWLFDAVERVNLAENKSADAAVVHLRSMRGIATTLDYSTMFPGNLGGMRNSVGLDLIDSTITDAGLENLKELRGLEFLILNNTRVTDAALVHLRGLGELVSLDLRGTGVTDSGLTHLTGLRNLTWLDVTDTQVTEEGAAQLEERFSDQLSVER